jgi:hypothetical protein
MAPNSALGGWDGSNSTTDRLRDEGAIGDEVLRRVQRDLDLETMLLESGEDDAPESPYDTR